MAEDRVEFELPLKHPLAASEQPRNRSYEKEQHQQGDNNTQEKNEQAALLFGDSVYRSEVVMMREVVPALDLMVIMELLHGNGFDLERSIDSALALMASLSAENGRAILSDSYSLPKDIQNPPRIAIPQKDYKQRSVSKEDFLPTSAQHPSASSSSSRNQAAAKRLSVNRTDNQESDLRGVPMILSQRFLSSPRYRLVVNKHSNASTDFTIYFRRKTEKLGITIQEQDSEIRIHTLYAKSLQEPLLALESGIKIGDILTGINSEYFSPGAEVQDIIDILHLAGTFVALHFTRWHIPDDISVQSYLSPHHKFANMLLDQTVISKERAGSVSKALRNLKERSLVWDSPMIAQRIENWKLDSCLNLSTVRNRNNSTAVTPDRSPLLSSENNSLIKTRDSASATPRLNAIPPHRHLRPAISVRLIRAEERTDHVVYVIWVMDIRSGAEWFVRRRFREFYEFRDVLVTIRAGIGRLDFPSKRLNVAEIGAMISERLALLQRFLRKICSLVCVNSLHPSTVRVQLLLQQFLEVTDRMENILFLEMKPTFLLRKNMVQVFVHNIMQMEVMDKVLSGYIDSFFESTNIEESKRWSENDGRKVLNGMKEFIDNLEIVLYDAIVDDCCEIMSKYAQPVQSEYGCPGVNGGPQTNSRYDTADRGGVTERANHHTKDRTNLIGDFNSIDVTSSMSPVRAHTGNVEVNRTPKMSRSVINGVKEGQKHAGDSSSSSPIDQEADDISSAMAQMCRDELELGKEREREREQRDIIKQCNEDEIRIMIRSAVRKQVEIEVFVPCSARLRIVLNRSFSGSESALRRNILKITHQTQNFFGIPLRQLSPTNWNEVVFLMREIRSYTLPHDRLEALLLTAKEIPLLFVREHPTSVADNVTLGADDFLPIFIYIIARAQIPDLTALSEELQALCDPDKRMSETGYYLATLEASLQHIIEANITTESQVLFPDMVRPKAGSDDGSSDDDEESTLISV